MPSTVRTTPCRLSPTRGQRAFLLTLLFAVLAGLLAHAGLAADSGKTIMLGESLDAAQKQELIDYFGAKPGDRIETITVADTQKAMSGIMDTNVQSAYSSTALTCGTLGGGLNVTTRNVTVITPSMYAMALVTAGIGDGTLVVAAPNDAPAEGRTALPGVFKTWSIAPCDSGSTSRKRQRLALEELALTVDIGNALLNIPAASNIVLETQKTVVIDKLTTSEAIDKALLAQENVGAVAIPADLRAKLADLMVRLAAQKIDWRTFSAGWTIEYNAANTQITMKGDGIAIRNAQLTATVRAANHMTSTAAAAANLTSTALAEGDAAKATADARSAALTATADAADAQATRMAIAGLTATAAAQPTQTPMPTPEPTATPAPVAVGGAVVDVSGGQIWVREAGSNAAIAYTVDGAATITRGGKTSPFGAIVKGDTVSMTVDGSSKHVTMISASAKPVAILSKLLKFIWVIPALLMIPLIFFLKGRVGGIGDPFIVKRTAAA
ncbi:MAG: DUF1002 domain-containing protein [Thermomicrobiales bacterium]